MNTMSSIVSRPLEGVRPYRVTADDYMRMIDAGTFGDAHVELVEGELIEMSPSHSQHGKILASLSFRLTAIYQPLGLELFIDTVTSISAETKRAPDICVVENHLEDQKLLDPATIVLAIEIAGTTLAEDIGRKRIDYATSGIRNYWVVDFEGRRTHCYADPQGMDYAAIRVVPFGEPVAVPGADAAIIVA